MPERITAGLRPLREAVRLVSNWNGLDDLARRRVDDVDDAIVAAGEPQMLAVDAQIAHVGTAGARQRPRGDDFPCGEVDDRHAALAHAGLAADLREPAVRDVELRPIATRIEAVRADSCFDEAGELERAAVDQVHASRAEIRDVEGRAV